MVDFFSGTHFKRRQSIMKKLLLTLAVGLSMLSLPVIAGAATTYDNYSGYTASVTVHGFTLYSTAKAPNPKMKAFADVEKATGTAKNVGSNVEGHFATDGSFFLVAGLLNSHTFIVFRPNDATDAIAPKNGRTVLGNAIIEIFDVSGATLDSSGNLVAPASAGQTCTEHKVVGGGILTANVNPTTHAMVLTMRNLAGAEIASTAFTSSGSPAVWGSGTTTYDSMVTGISISPIKLNLNGAYNGAWWQ